jgi:hypothetical protein
MGNFYVNHTVRSMDISAVSKALAGRRAFLSPPDKGCIVVFERHAEFQEVEEIMELGRSLSAKLDCVVLSVANYDDDVLMFFAFSSGVPIEPYGGNPDQSDDRTDSTPEKAVAVALCHAFGAKDSDRVISILSPSGEGSEPYVFETDRHRDLVEALGLSSAAVGFGFTYIEQGELPVNLQASEFIAIG